MEEIDHEEMEVEKLETALLQAEYKYRADVMLLQQALVRSKRIHNLHMITLHLKVKPLLKTIKNLPLQYLFYKWKAKCNIDRTYRVKKVSKLIRYIYKKQLAKAFILFRERGNRLMMEMIINPGYRNYHDGFQGN